MEPVNDCLLEVATHVDIVIDNADAYQENGVSYIWRWKLSGEYSSYVFAHQDIAGTVNAAIKCIDVMDKHDMPK